MNAIGAKKKICLLLFLWMGVACKAQEEPGTKEDPMFPQTATLPEAPAADSTPFPKKNIILIIVDSLRVDHVGVYGYDQNTTPNLDTLAEKSVVFDNAYSSSSWTRASVASILSGKTPAEHGIASEKRFHILDDRWVTLPEYAQTKGLQTHAIITNPNYRFGLEQGFQTVERSPNGRASTAFLDAMRFIQKTSPKPFFLLIHNNDPHDAYEYHEGFSKNPPSSPYRKLEAFLPARRDGRGFRFDSTDKNSAPVQLNASEIQEMKENYDGEVAYWDDNLGKFMRFLQSEVYARSTIVIVTADHGEEFLDHGSYWHGGTLYDELTHVPLIVHIPEKTGLRVPDVVGTIRLFPTLVDLLGGDREFTKTLSVASLLPMMNGESKTEGYQPILMVTAFRGKLKTGIVLGPERLIRYEDGPLIGLFDTRRDPKEQNNLAPTNPGRVAELTRMLDELVGNGFENAKPSGNNRTHPVVDQETQHQLKELGYIAD